ncbi:MAG TPA: hypothetical protein VJ032_12180 [Thermoanaerobaculia bacterium]|nr:hypothetical protein [Thermoanaerobaculia bacterium]
MKKPGDTPGFSAISSSVASLMTQLDERLEHIERQLFRVHDAAEVVERRAALLHIVDADVVLAQKLVCFLIGHIAPPEVGGELSAQRGLPRQLFRRYDAPV